MRLLRLAPALGVAGGALGVLAGIVQATVGSRIPDWSGAKGSPVALGILTVLLSLLATWCAYGLRGTAPIGSARRLALVIGLTIPAGLCFSTVGRLWFLPGPLLLCCAALALAGGSRREFNEAIRSNWLAGLVSLLGAFEILMAVSATPVAAAVGVLGGVALLVAPWLTSRSRGVAIVLLVLGAVPFAALTYWAVVPVVLALLVPFIAGPLLLRASPRVAPIGSVASLPTPPSRAPGR